MLLSQGYVDKLAGIESNATRDQTGAEIRAILDVLFGGTTWRTQLSVRPSATYCVIGGLQLAYGVWPATRTSPLAYVRAFSAAPWAAIATPIASNTTNGPREAQTVKTPLQRNQIQMNSRGWTANFLVIGPA